MDFVYEIPNNLSDEKCEEIIKRFEADKRKTRGVVGTEGLVHDIKTSVDLSISGCEDWKDIDMYLHEQLEEGIKQYKTHLNDDLSYSGLEHMFSPPGAHDRGYQVQKSVVGGYYSWHSDSMVTNGRFLTFLWYLTSHDHLQDGGGTAFHPMIGGSGKVIQPRRGTLLVFPATWTYAHMGLPLIRGDPKYVCTGWLCSDNA